jgi:N-acetylglucosaminyl-diphospho-decaprenol L-rhamnosyltransferase
VTISTLAGRGERAPPKVTIAVVSWNTRSLLVDCLRSLEPEVGARRAAVWVVDNASNDGSAEAARSEAPWATVLEPGQNLGFGRAVNLVARQTETPWLAAANADVELEPGALDSMLAAGTDARVGAVAPRLVLPGGAVQHSVHPFPTLPFTLLFNLGVPRLSRRLSDRLCLEGSWDPERPREVPWAIGAFLLLRRSAFDEAGGFDDEQWLYAEDLDLGWRLRSAGWVTRYEPRARVRHHASAATTAAFGDEKTARFMAATYAALLRRRGLPRTWATAAVNVAGAAVRAVWNAPLAGVSPRRRAALGLNRRWLAAHREGLRSRAGLLRGR